MWLRPHKSYRLCDSVSINCAQFEELNICFKVYSVNMTPKRMLNLMHTITSSGCESCIECLSSTIKFKCYVVLVYPDQVWAIQ